MSVRTRSLALGGAAVVILGIAAVPVLGQAPSPTPAAAASASPFVPPGHSSDKPGNGPKTDKGEKAEKAEEVAVSLTGVVGAKTDGEGRASYTLTVGSKVYSLEVGPPWFWGANNPLAPFVGKSTTITGEQATGSDEVEVFTAGGTTIREPGKPPWAGGWKVVGERHPGWAQWKVDKMKAKFGDGKPGRATAPGQQKDKTTPQASAKPGS